MLNSRFGSPERTVALFRRALALRPGGLHHLSFGLVLAQQGQTGEAIEQMEIALGSYRQELSPPADPAGASSPRGVASWTVDTSIGGVPGWRRSPS